MIALAVLMIAAGAVMRWGIGSNTATDVIGIILIAAGTVLLATLVATGRWWKMRQRSLPDSTKV